MKVKSKRQFPENIENSDYKNLKAKYKRLADEYLKARQDVLTLIQGKDFLRITEIKMAYHMRLKAEEQIWAGNPTKTQEHEGN